MKVTVLFKNNASQEVLAFFVLEENLPIID